MNSKNKVRAVISGGAGFIGSNLGDFLVNEGFEVHVIDDLSGGKKENVHRQAILHITDIRNYEEIEKIFDEHGPIEYLFHTAALPRVQFSIENPLKTNTVNVCGTLKLLHLAKEVGVKRFIYSASSSAYGDQKVMPLTEEVPPKPKSPYGLQKYIGELYCRTFSEIYGLPTVSLRYFNVYGPKFDPEGPYALVVGKFLKQKKNGIPLTITGDGNQTRDFTHVNDVVRANILAMQSDKVGEGEVINIGAGNNISINELARLIGGPTEYIPPRLEPRDTLADNKKARELLGWQPQISIEDGIASLKKWFDINYKE